MSKTFDKISDGLKVNFDRRPTDEFINFLNKYNTSNVDTTLSNLTDWASRSSADNLKNMGDYQFGVNASDAARREAENATYESYLKKLIPQYEGQIDRLQTRLLNMGLGVDTPAYQNAMASLEQNQNSALNDAAYQSVLAGQNAYTQDLNNQISAANFSNSAQQDYINQLLSALTNSKSSYDVATDKYNAGNNLAINKANAQNQSLTQKLKALDQGADGAGAIAAAIAAMMMA